MATITDGGKEEAVGGHAGLGGPAFQSRISDVEEVGTCSSDGSTKFDEAMTRSCQPPPTTRTAAEMASRAASRTDMAKA